MENTTDIKVEELFTTDPKSGLTSQEVATRVSEGKVNGNQNVKTKSIWQIIRTNAFTFFNVLFAIFSIIIIAFDLGLSELGFLVIVIFNLAIGIVQEVKAKRTIDKLSLISAPKVTALRDGVECEIKLEDIVMDDLILLETGNQICADARIIEGTIEVNESQITGEPDAITKNPGDEIFSGSFIVSGRAVSQVIRIGKDNYATKISSGAKYIKKTSSQLMISLMRFIKLMTAIIVPLGIILLCTKLLIQSLDYKTALLDTVTMMVSMIPSGLVALTSAVFCVSVVRLSKHKALAQDLYAAESLARVDVLCLDKTGTITEGTMEVHEVKAVNVEYDELLHLIKNVVTAIGDNNPTANAMKEYLTSTYVTEETQDVIPFSSARKWSGANLSSGGYAIGACEFILKETTEEIDNTIKEYSEKGYRVLIVTRSASPIIDNTLNDDMTLIGYIFITDKIRQEAPETLAYFAEQGVTIKIISGDNPVTVKSIAERAGVQNADSYVDVSTLSDDEIADAIENYTVFGRVTPDRKLAFVKALKAKGHTVAMTGDGVNDVLALKESDCSVAMAAGSDAAKNVSQVVLLDSNFASMPKIVAEGRRSINNLERSASLFLVKTFYSLFLAITFLFIHEELPYSLINLTILSGLSVGLPSFILALEPNKERVKGKFLDKIIFRALPGSICIAIVVIAMTLLKAFIPSLESAFTAQYSFETTCILVMAFVSFMYLFRVCMPFDKVRVVLFIGMLALYILAFIISPYIVKIVPALDFKLTHDLPMESLYVALPMAVITVPIFLLMTNALSSASEKEPINRMLDKLKDVTFPFYARVGNRIKNLFTRKHK